MKFALKFLRSFGKIALLLFVVIIGGFSSAAAQDEKPEAYLRSEPPGSANYYIEVNMKRDLDGTIDAIRASVRDLDKKKLVSTKVVPSPLGNRRFRITLTETEDKIIEQNQNYRVFVDAFPTATGVIDSEIAVGKDVSAELVNLKACLSPAVPYPIIVTLKAHSEEADRNYANERFAAVRLFLLRANIEQRLAVKITPKAEATREFPAQSVDTRFDSASNAFRICAENAAPLPVSGFDLEFRFDASAPFELRQKPLLLKGLSGADATTPVIKPDEGGVGKRSLERNLDLGVTLTSSVADEKQANGTTVRNRKTRGTLDLRLVPVLNLRRVNPTRKGGTVRFFTPVYLDARVSTGKVTDDTLSLNRIVIGSEYEFRQYLDFKDGYADLLRYQIRFNNASDRDFKQIEYNFGFEFQPLFGRVNRPLGSEKDLVGKEIVETPNTFGYSVIPVAGVQWGRTYKVRDPQNTPETSRNIRRFYFGGDFSLNATKFIKFSISDRFFLRGETSPNKWQNYFLGTIEAPFGTLTKDTTHGLFVSFERGNQPPFSNPDVNAFKFGYRIQANPGWFNRRR